MNSEVKEEPPDGNTNCQPSIITIQPESPQLTAEMEIDSNNDSSPQTRESVLDPPTSSTIEPVTQNDSISRNPIVVMPQPISIQPINIRSVISNPVCVTLPSVVRPNIHLTNVSGVPKGSNVSPGSQLIRTNTGKQFILIPQVSSAQVYETNTTVTHSVSNTNTFHGGSNKVRSIASQGGMNSTPKNMSLGLTTVSTRNIGDSLSTTFKTCKISQSGTRMASNANSKVKNVQIGNFSAHLSQNVMQSQALSQGNNQTSVASSLRFSNIAKGGNVPISNLEEVDGSVLAIISRSSHNLLYHCNFCNFLSPDSDKMKSHYNFNHRRLCHIGGCSFSCSTYLQRLEHFHESHPWDKDEYGKYDMLYVQKRKQADKFTVSEFCNISVVDQLRNNKQLKSIEAKSTKSSSEISMTQANTTSTKHDKGNSTQQSSKDMETDIFFTGKEFVCHEADCSLKSSFFTLFQCHNLHAHNMFVYESGRKTVLSAEKAGHCMEWILKYGEKIDEVENFCYFCPKQRTFDTNNLLIFHALITHRIYVDEKGKGVQLNKKEAVKCLQLIKQRGVGYCIDEAEIYVKNIIAKKHEIGSKGKICHKKDNAPSLMMTDADEVTIPEIEDDAMQKSIVKCFYCEEHSTSLDQILSHVTSEHPDKPVKVKRSVKRSNKNTVATELSSDFRMEESTPVAYEWSCHYCNVKCTEKETLITHTKQTHVGSKLILDRRRLEHFGGKNDAVIKKEPAERNEEEPTNLSSGNSGTESPTLGTLQLKTEEDSQSENLGNATPSQVLSSSSVEVSSSFYVQKIASCGHYIPSFDNHEICKSCRVLNGNDCKEQGPMCNICRNWSQEFWQFIKSAYPDAQTSSKPSKSRKCTKCSRKLAHGYCHAECTSCKSKEQESQNHNIDENRKSIVAYNGDSEGGNDYLIGGISESDSEEVMENSTAAQKSDRQNRNTKSSLRINFEESSSHGKRNIEPENEYEPPLKKVHLEDKFRDAEIEYMNHIPKDLMRTDNEQYTYNTESMTATCNHCFHTICGPRAKKTMIIHVKIHTGKVWGCPYCIYKACFSKDVYRHVSKQHTQKKLKIVYRKPKKYRNFARVMKMCGYCKYQHTNKKQILRHHREKHKNKVFQTRNVDSKLKKRYRCLHCEYSTNYPNDVKRHIKSMHPRKEIGLIDTEKANSDQIISTKRYRCLHCEYSTNYPNDVNRHIKKIHPGKEIGRIDTKEVNSNNTISGDMKVKSDSQVPPSLYMYDGTEQEARCTMCKYVSRGTAALFYVRNHIYCKHPGERQQLSALNSPEISNQSSSETNSTAVLWKCAYCNKRSNFKNSIRRHQRARHRSKIVKFIPIKSNTEAPATSNAEKSIEIIDKSSKKEGKSNIEANVPYRCTGRNSYCNKCDFAYAGRLAGTMATLHYAKVHPTDQKVYGCGYCKFSTFIRRNVRSHHIKVHPQSIMKIIFRKITSEVSQENGKVQNKMADLENTIQNVNARVLQKCAYCSFTSVYFHSVIRHCKTSHSNKPPRCVRDIQEKKISSDKIDEASINNKGRVGLSGSLHKYDISGKKYVKCAYCKFTTQYKSSIIRHTRTIHPRKHPRCLTMNMPQETQSQNPKYQVESHDGSLAPVTLTALEDDTFASQYTYLPDSKVASCLLCTYTSTGIKACQSVVEHIQENHANQLIFDKAECKMTVISKRRISTASSESISTARSKSPKRFGLTAGENKKEFSGITTFENDPIKVRARKPWKCPYCPLRCFYKSSIVKHMKKFHVNKQVKVTNRVELVEKKQKRQLEIVTLPYLPDDMNVNEPSYYSFDEKKNHFQCNHCSYSNLFEYQLKDHILSHTGGKLWGCPYCDTKRNRKKAMSKHVNQIHSKEPYKIVRRKPWANPVYNSVSNRDIPQNIKKEDCVERKNNPHIEKRDKIDNEFNITELSYLPDDLNFDETRYYRYNKTEKMYNCKKCPFKNQLLSKTKRHIFVHTGAKLWGCPYCDYKCNRRSQICAHVKRIHQTQPYTVIRRKPSIVKLKIEEKPQEKLNQMENIKPKESNSVLEIVPLDYLPKDLDIKEEDYYFYNKSKRCYQCKHCDLNTSSQRSIKNHLLVHSGGKLWGCPYCDFKYNRRLRMIKHVQSQHKDQPVKIIRRGSSRKSVMEKSVIHSFWRCAYCSRQSVLKGVIQNHILFAHPGADQLEPAIHTHDPLYKVKNEDLKKGFINLIKIEDMTKYPLLNDVLETNGKDLNYDGYGIQNDFSSTEMINHSLGELCDQQEITCVNLPHIDDVVGFKGMPKKLPRISETPVCFNCRFECSQCEEKFDDLTEAKSHTLNSHGRDAMQNKDGSQFFLVIDKLAKLKFTRSRVFVCPNPDCVFFSRLWSLYIDHKECSVNWSDVWGLENIAPNNRGIHVVSVNKVEQLLPKEKIYDERVDEKSNFNEAQCTLNVGGSDNDQTSQELMDDFIVVAENFSETSDLEEGLDIQKESVEGQTEGMEVEQRKGKSVCYEKEIKGKQGSTSTMSETIDTDIHISSQNEENQANVSEPIIDIQDFNDFLEDPRSDVSITSKKDKIDSTIIQPSISSTFNDLKDLLPDSLECHDKEISADKNISSEVSEPANTIIINKDSLIVTSEKEITEKKASKKDNKIDSNIISDELMDTNVNTSSLQGKGETNDVLDMHQTKDITSKEDVSSKTGDLQESLDCNKIDSMEQTKDFKGVSSEKEIKDKQTSSNMSSFGETDTGVHISSQNEANVTEPDLDKEPRRNETDLYIGITNKEDQSYSTITKTNISTTTNDLKDLLQESLECEMKTPNKDKTIDINIFSDQNIDTNIKISLLHENGETNITERNTDIQNLEDNFHMNVTNDTDFNKVNTSKDVSSINVELQETLDCNEMEAMKKNNGKGVNTQTLTNEKVGLMIEKEIYTNEQDAITSTYNRPNVNSEKLFEKEAELMENKFIQVPGINPSKHSIETVLEDRETYADNITVENNKLDNKCENIESGIATNLHKSQYELDVKTVSDNVNETTQEENYSEFKQLENVNEQDMNSSSMDASIISDFTSKYQFEEKPENDVNIPPECSVYENIQDLSHLPDHDKGNVNDGQDKDEICGLTKQSGSTDEFEEKGITPEEEEECDKLVKYMTSRICYKE